MTRLVYLCFGYTRKRGREEAPGRGRGGRGENPERGRGGVRRARCDHPFSGLPGPHPSTFGYFLKVEVKAFALTLKKIVVKYKSQNFPVLTVSGAQLRGMEHIQVVKP